MKRPLSLLAVVASAALLQGQTPGPAPAKPPPERMNFVGCPVMRDTREVPCWLAEHKGELYYLGVQEDISGPFHPPQLKHRVLVEGVKTSKKLCGATVIEPLVISVLPEVEPACNRILPAQGHKVDWHRRGPGPANRGLQLATDPNPPPGRQPAPPPEPPYRPTPFVVRFGFDGEYINVHNFYGVQGAVAYAKAAKARSVEVRGARAAVLLSDGSIVTEQPRMAKLRAEKVGKALRELGIPADTLKVSWNEQAAPPNGVDDYERRRVEILVTP